MKIVQSFWSKPAFHAKQDFFNSRGFGGWYNYKYFLMGNAFSCLSIRKHHNKISLVTDDKGYDLFINLLKLPYDDVALNLNSLNDEDHRLWILGKMLAIRLQDKPFIHIDNDVFTWRELPFSSKPDYLITQSRFSMSSGYKSSLNEIFANFSYVPDCMKERPTQDTLVSNVGIIGGNDIDFFQEFCDISLDLLEKNRKSLDLVTVGGFNQMLEEYLFTCLTRHKQYFVHHLVNSLDPGDYLKIYFVPTIQKYIHLVGGWKQDQFGCEQIALRLKYEFPAHYDTIMEVINEPLQNGTAGAQRTVSLREEDLFKVLEVFYNNNFDEIMRKKVRIKDNYEILTVRDFHNTYDGHIVKEIDPLTSRITYRQLIDFSSTGQNDTIKRFSTPLSINDLFEELTKEQKDKLTLEELKIKVLDVVIANIVLTGVLEFC